MQDTVLIVDDDEAVSKMLCKVMKSNDLLFDTAMSGEEALKKLNEKKYSLMLLDINMHEIDGFEVLETVRKSGNKMPIIIVSGRKEDFDTLYGLDIGADEYITKPFNPITLGASVKALLRRSNGSLSEGTRLTAGPFSFDTVSMRFFKNGNEILLTGKESALMKLFMDNINRVFSKEMLYDLIWGNVIVDEGAIMVYINRLRQKIEDNPDRPQYIQTLRGIGYRFIVIN